ncbi:hypothetical protein MMF93_30440 [Streptomyces tubbatahanensis]|uniref:Secreted protein n=1 Tax=Streptomyces tubbatahanensis TaxID=2923272 RepID=A0ABY3Y135_9ACTN|nr:hypothetical protein [Streptomyces tubbatahanensis]UNT00302.1 hypothetical protein MMF93_30440 [Streptomyces tubbatahanensis]
MNHRRRNLLLAITLAVVLLAVGGGWATGAFTDWRDSLSMRDACDGVLAGDDDVRDTLGGERVFAEDVQQDSRTRDALTHCLVRGSDQTQPALRVDVRWSKDAHKEALPQGRADTWQETGTVAPIGKGWPGAVSAVGDDFHATVALACPDGKKAEGKSSLLVTADLGRDARHNDSHVRTSLARFTTGTAAKAADKYGCPTAQQHRPEKVAEGPLDHSVPLTEARGSCSAVRGLSRKEQHSRIARAQETPADNDVPSVRLLPLHLRRRARVPAVGHLRAVREELPASRGLLPYPQRVRLRQGRALLRMGHRRLPRQPPTSPLHRVVRTQRPHRQTHERKPLTRFRA